MAVRSILLKAFQTPGAKLRADLRTGVLPTLNSFTIREYSPPLLGLEKSQYAKENPADFEAAKLFSRPK